MAKDLRILIVDDQRHTRQSLKALIGTKFQFIEMFEAENGVGAVKCAEEWVPDIVLMDARMPDMDGIEATRVIKQQKSDVKVIVLSMFAEYEAAALEAGADTFISKGKPPEDLLAALSVIVDLL
jgi:YesN/AraC family two-component response regulator